MKYDLTGRVKEIPVTWSEDELSQIFVRGGEALDVEFAPDVVAQAIRDCFGNAGILQRLILGSLDEAGI